LELATKFYEKQLWDGSGKEKILAYLKGRGLSDDSIRKFRLGYAPDGWRHVNDFLISRGFRAEELEQAGLILKKEGGSGHYDRFRDRIMFPIFDILGRVIGYSARVSPGGDESQAKYINTPETPLYHKSRALYGFSLAKQAMKHSGATIIVEGNMDIIAMHQAGIENTVAVSGTALTEEQLAIMKRYGNEVKLFFDMDGAGQKAARKSAELALEKELLVSIIALSSGKDAADMGRDDPEKLCETVAHPVPALRYFLDAILAKYDRQTSDGKRKIVEEYAELLMAVKNPIERAHWVKELSREIGMEEKLVIGVVNIAFLERERRERAGYSETKRSDPFQAAHSFGKRSELLREELVGLMYADVTVRQAVLGLLLGNETKAFLEKHPLYFFIIQGGAERDPLLLIEDAALKSEATRLSFRALESPETATVTAEERAGKMIEIAKRYLDDLHSEVSKREKLIFLEQAIREAREKGDKELEKKLLSEFVSVSSGRLPM
jgi:DNA primase catalytic core